MNDEEFKKLLNWLRTLEINERGRVDTIKLQDFDLTPDQEKTINDEFGAKHERVGKRVRNTQESVNDI